MNFFNGKLSVTEAHKIVRVYGRHIEYCESIVLPLFLGTRPESFLPFPKALLEEALDIVFTHHHNAGDLQNAKLTQDVTGMLMFYGDDEEALLLAAKHINDEEKRKKYILPVLRNGRTEHGRFLIGGLDR